MVVVINVKVLIYHFKQWNCLYQIFSNHFHFCLRRPIFCWLISCLRPITGSFLAGLTWSVTWTSVFLYYFEFCASSLHAHKKCLPKLASFTRRFPAISFWPFLTKFLVMRERPFLKQHSISDRWLLMVVISVTKFLLRCLVISGFSPLFLIESKSTSVIVFFSFGFANSKYVDTVHACVLSVALSPIFFQVLWLVQAVPWQKVSLSKRF